jgi:hypothetical protein
MEALSSCGPQEKAQLPPPTAHAPKPIGVSHISELPSCSISIVWHPFASIFSCVYLTGFRSSASATILTRLRQDKSLI